MVASRPKPDFADHAEQPSQRATGIGGPAPGAAPTAALIARATFLAVLAIVTALALYPRLQLPEPGILQGNFDKVTHVLAFMALATLGTSAWPRRWPVIGGLVFYAVTLEWSQRFSAGREVNILDALASLAGLALGFALVMAARRIRARLITTPPAAAS